MDRKRFGLHNARRLKRTAGIVTAIAVFCGIVKMLDYIYLAPQDQEWERILWHHFYEDRGRIDNLYIGSSHVYLGILPQMLDEINGQYNFNLASTAQPINGTYFLLREAENNNDLSHVYIELYYNGMVKNIFDQNSETMDTEIYRNWQNTDYMEFSLNKLEYMLAIAGPEKYIDICMPFSRYREFLNNWHYIRQTVERKQQEEYLSYEYHKEFEDCNGYDDYQKQGYFQSTREFLEKERLYPQQRVLNENPIGEKSEQYLRKILDYCQRKNILVTLFVVPMDDLQLISTENYDNYIDQINEIAGEYKVLFYDFNLAKEEYLPIRQGKYFRDVGHLNYAGAQMFTPFFYQVVSGDDNEKYFYDSYSEKLKSTAPAVYGLYYRDSENGTEESASIRTMWIASNREESMEYRVVLTPNDGEPYVIQDFKNLKEFEISKEEHGICTITARMKGAAEQVQMIEVNY